jgi:signal transduction histidine kinase/CheY-like chemotaxis protein
MQDAKTETTESGAEPVTPIDRIRAEQIKALYRNGPVGILTSLGTAIVLAGALVYVGDLPPVVASLFLTATLANSIIRMVLVRHYWEAAPAAADWPLWARRFSVTACVAHLTWGLGAVWLMIPGRFDLQLLVVLVIIAIESGVVSTFGSYRPAFLLSVLSILVPVALWSAIQGDALHDALALVLVFRILIVWLVGRNFNRGFIESLRLRFENVELVDDLRRQKELAEQASIAKSRFLASTSHDLRQPVHALGMFVGALRQHEMTDEMRRLVEHIDGSVTAMDGLFAALLDISRLDAGVIRSHPASFAIQPVLERICRDQQAEAAEKGLRLVLHSCSAVVRTDPLLLERVLRNLVSNAVRYTDHGRVVVGCRRGARLGVQVWDTGRGIPPAQQERVFQEFYQMENPERDRTKGLGLGLAIVKRLTVLLDCPLTLRSEPGRGSVFAVEVPYATEAAAATQGSDPPEAALARGLILVIDDESAIQDAMSSLLASWGYAVIAASSCDEMLERISICPDRPLLIISDYRLRAEENGIAVIERLHQEYNEDIPAVLITGDTAPDRLKEAQSSGFPLLHKPVASGKLRAAIGNLTSAKPAVAPDA